MALALSLRFAVPRRLIPPPLSKACRGIHCAAPRLLIKNHPSERLTTGPTLLSAEEGSALAGLVGRLTTSNPEVARALLIQLRDGSELFEPEKGRRVSVSALSKVAGAKLQKRQGKGKTAFFSLLSDVDKLRVLELTQAEGAKDIAEGKKDRTRFFANLPGEVKFMALKAWQREREESSLQAAEGAESGAPGSTSIPPRQLLYVFLSQAAPMVGFGFADNFLMIVFGETIDAQFGLYVSTMAAAGLGNLCSNIVGLGLADYIEHVSAKMGVPRPRLTTEQRESTMVRGFSFLGTAGGVTCGCLLGMVPLLWIGKE